MFRVIKILVWFGIMAGVGILLGCYIHGQRVNQPTIMSGVAFVRELPYGESMVGYLETMVFSYQERRNLDKYMDHHRGKIQINPDVLKQHEQLYGGGTKKP